jgi:hypothetical protein
MNEIDRRQALLEACTALTEVIRAARVIPSGELYANVMGQLPLPVYQAIIGILEASGLIRVKNHLITWTGPVPKSPTVH